MKRENIIENDDRIKQRTKIETDTVRLRKYVDENGFWFASCPDYEAVAEELCTTGELRRVREIVDHPGADGFYVPACIKTENALPHSLYNLLC